MIVKSKQELEVATNSSENDMSLEIDASQSGKLFAMLLESYKNPRASLVREYTSNAWDAHNEIGKNDIPVVVEIDEDDEGRFIQFVDKGVGMSYGFFNRTYRKLLKSTKDKSNDSIGGFGIGSKSALAYTQYYHVETVKNGRLNHFVIYKERNDVIKITRIAYKKDATLENGTTVKVYFKEGIEDSEEKQFEEITVKELCYFDNVVIRYRQNKPKATTYNYGKIVEGQYFKYNTAVQYSSETHLVVGKVCYPIDFRELGLNSWEYRTPIGVKIAIGELSVHMNRETILYTDETKALIKDRLAKAVQELVIRYNSQNKPIVNIFNYIVKKGENSDIKAININDLGSIFLYGDAFTKEATDLKLAISTLLGLKNSPNKYDVLSPFYEIVGRIYNGKFKPSSGRISDLMSMTKIVIYKNKVPDSKEFAKYVQDAWVIREISYSGSGSGYKHKYSIIKQKLSNDNFITTKVRLDRYGDLNRTENSSSYNSVGFAKRLLAYKREIKKQLLARFYNNIPDYDNFEIPIEWKEEQKRLAREARQSIERAKGVIPCKQIHNSRYVSQKDLDLSTLVSFKGIIIYGFQENNVRLKQTADLLTCNRVMERYEGLNDKAVKIYQIAKNNEKSMENFKNAIHVNNFLMSNNRIIVRIYTAVKIKEAFGSLLENTNSFKNLNTKVYDNLNKLCSYVDKVNVQLARSSELLSDLEDLNKLIPLFDSKVKQEYDDCTKYFKDLEILKDIPDLRIISQANLMKLLKKHGKMLNYTLYHKQKTTKEIVQEITKFKLVECPVPDLKNYTPKPIKLNN